MRGKKEAIYFSQSFMITRAKVFESRYRVTVPKLLRLDGTYDELTLEQNLSDAFYNGEIKRKHGKDCFVYELTRKEIEKYCASDGFDYTQLEKFKRRTVYNVNSIMVIETKVERYNEAMDEWHSLSARQTFANPKREAGQTVFYQWRTDLPPEAE